MARMGVKSKNKNNTIYRIDWRIYLSKDLADDLTFLCERVP